jgi:hypothetical protein
LIAQKVRDLFPFIVQFHDSWSSLIRISIMLLEMGDFTSEEWLELHPKKSARIDAMSMDGRFFLPTFVRWLIILTLFKKMVLRIAICGITATT